MSSRSPYDASAIVPDLADHGLEDRERHENADGRYRDAPELGPVRRERLPDDEPGGQAREVFHRSGVGTGHRRRRYPGSVEGGSPLPVLAAGE